MNFKWNNENSQRFLNKGYLTNGETAQERIRVIADRAEELLGIEGLSDKIYDYTGRGWISFSSPVWSNFGKRRGLPISCFSSHVPDNIPGILHAQSEIGVMSKMGGGTSAYFGDVRPRGSEITDSGKTSGAVHFMELFDTVTNVVSQGGVRRGYCSAYLPAEHGDIDEFLNIGTEGNPIQDMTTGVTFKDEWIQEMIDGDGEKRAIWAKMLKRRSEVGYPYVFFHGNVNRNKPDVYKDLGLEITNSQMCTEILLPISEEESFVCDLSSVNMLHYDDWKNTDLIEVVIYLLDAVMEEFLIKLEEFRDSDILEDQMTFEYMKRAYTFAKRHRALGLGVLGWASYLQKNMIPFTSDKANALTDEYFANIRDKANGASVKLANMLGEPEILKGYGRRNTTLLAIAPTTSSAFILGQVSQSIEPPMSNYYIKDLAKIKAEIKNPYLEALLEEKGHNTPSVWESIAQNDGSVLHLTFLSDEEKQVFLTFKEIDPYGIIDQAAIRQQYLDQTQSLNLMIPSSASVKEINSIVLHAWEMGICTLYYQHSTNAAQQFSKVNCTACE